MTNYLREARAEEAQANTAAPDHGDPPAPLGEAGHHGPDGGGDRPRGGHAAERDRRPGAVARPPQPGPGRGAEERPHHRRQVERITKIIRQVLDFSRKSRPTLGQADVRQVVAESLEFIDEICKRQRIETAVVAPDDLPSIPGDPGEIQQVCLTC
jgi:signal transduction histidine kinase